MEVLEDEADVPAHPPQGGVVRRFDVVLQDPDPPGGGALESVDVAQQRGLARSGESQQHRHLARLEAQGHVVQAQDLGAEPAGDGVELDAVVHAGREIAGRDVARMGGGLFHGMLPEAVGGKAG